MLNNTTLQHYGILGMKWGRRTSRPGGPGDPNNSADHNKALSLKTKKAHEMSNDEIQALTRRLQLEKQLKDLTPSQTSAGQKFLIQILTNVAEQSVKNYTNKYLNQGVEALLAKTTAAAKSES